jgi:uncharacterized membrane protein HdeD (DUF308 family)
MSEMIEPGEALARLGRHWGWVMAFGLITFAAGIAVLVWPGETLLVVAVLFGIQLIVTGLFRFVGAFAVSDVSGGTRVLFALLGVLAVIVGLWAVRHAMLTLIALIVLLGIFWVVHGAIEIFGALSQRDMPERGWTIAMGVLGVLAGIIVLAFPGLSLVGLAVILGIWLAIYGVMEVVASFRLRSVGHAAARTIAPAH